MEQMNVQEMTDRLKVRYKRISEPTKVLWDKSVRYIKDMNVSEVDDDVAADYLEYAENNWSESTVKCRIGILKGLWNKAGRKKLYRGDNPWLDLDDGLEISRREPTVHPWTFTSTTTKILTLYAFGIQACVLESLQEFTQSTCIWMQTSLITIWSTKKTEV